MIIGVGTDIVQITRIEKALQKYQEAFKNKILAKLELELLSKLPKLKHASFLAKRFAAKEAISKAIGSGIGGYIGFKDIAILNDSAGKPYAKISPDKEIGNLKIDISIADDYPVAVAFSVVSKR